MADCCAQFKLVSDPMAMELSPRQINSLERLGAAGFRPIAISPYVSALCIRKGECAVVLAPVPNGGLKVLAPASYLVEGNFGVRLKRGNGEVFVWKKSEIPATPERLAELDAFRQELSEILELAPAQ
jgi:hypothetical protein